MKLKMLYIPLLAAMLSGTVSCKYNDDYLNPSLDEKVAFFASKPSYTRTLIVGEGLQFKVGAAIAGMIENKRDEHVYMFISRQEELPNGKTLLPVDYYNGEELSGTIDAVVPKGQFIGYFTVKMDSLNFLRDPETITGKYCLPVKLVETSLNKVNPDANQVFITLKYMARFEGNYLFNSTVTTDGVSRTEASKNESDNACWKFSTVAPFTVKVSPSAESSCSGIEFLLSVDMDNNVSITAADGMPVVTADGPCTYDSKTRDFGLNFKYTDPQGKDVHVSTVLTFRNRMVDEFNQTREYLSHFNQ